MNNSISVSTVAYDGYDMATTLQSISNLGFEVVELAHIRGNSETFDERNMDQSHAEQVCDLLAQYDLTCRCLSAHMDLSSPDAIEAMERRLIYANSIGARYLATKSAPKSRRPVFVENLRRIAEIASDLDVVLLMENPSDASQDVVDDGPTGAAFLAEMALDNVRFNYDFGNLMSHHQGRVRPETDCLAALPFCVHLHVKDVRRTEDGWVHTAIGQGDIDYRSVLATLNDLVNPPLLSIEIPTRLNRKPNGTALPPLPPMPFGEIEMMLRESVAFLEGERW